MPLPSGEASGSIFWRGEKSERDKVVSVFQTLVEEDLPELSFLSMALEGHDGGNLIGRQLADEIHQTVWI